MVINLIQDIATPHNNTLIAKFKEKPDIKINLWYAINKDQNKYNWKEDISNEYIEPQFYGKFINWNFLKYCITKSDEKFILVGWVNINTILIHLLFFLFRRPFNHWTDLPYPHNQTTPLKKKFKRWFAYKILKYSNVKIFAVGATCIEYFTKMGFPKNRIVNLPIFVETDENNLFFNKKNEILSKYNIEPSNFIISSGSRIVYEKGFDLLIQAIHLLNDQEKNKIKLIIVGSGEFESKLKNLIKNLSLSSQVILERWLPIDEFKNLIYHSNVFIHPSRFDAYGATIYAMSLGVPVIGSFESGAANDRINQGKNGFLYKAEDIQTLANFISFYIAHPEVAKEMGVDALNTSLKWSPSVGVQIIFENII